MLIHFLNLNQFLSSPTQNKPEKPFIKTAYIHKLIIKKTSLKPRELIHEATGQKLQQGNSDVILGKKFSP